jgi:hypothetical protein
MPFFSRTDNVSLVIIREEETADYHASVLISFAATAIDVPLIEPQICPLCAAPFVYLFPPLLAALHPVTAPIQFWGLWA